MGMYLSLYMHAQRSHIMIWVKITSLYKCQTISCVAVTPVLVSVDEDKAAGHLQVSFSNAPPPRAS